jgi:hypothetical protein
MSSVNTMQKPKFSKLQNITFSAEHELIELARARARASKTTLNEEFRNWLRQFANARRDEEWYFEFMNQFIGIEAGRKFSREDFYEE